MLEGGKLKDHKLFQHCGNGGFPQRMSYMMTLIHIYVNPSKKSHLHNESQLQWISNSLWILALFKDDVVHLSLGVALPLVSPSTSCSFVFNFVCQYSFFFHSVISFNVARHISIMMLYFMFSSSSNGSSGETQSLNAGDHIFNCKSEHFTSTHAFLSLTSTWYWSIHGDCAPEVAFPSPITKTSRVCKNGTEISHHEFVVSLCHGEVCPWLSLECWDTRK